MELLSRSADAIPATLTLATDVLRLPPLDGSAPVSEAASETPTTLARRPTASPLKVAACAKLASKPKVNTVVNHAAILAFLTFCPPISFRFLPPKLSSRCFATANREAATGGANFRPKSLQLPCTGQMEIRPCDDEGVLTFSESCHAFAARSALEGNIQHRLGFGELPP